MYSKDGMFILICTCSNRYILGLTYARLILFSGEKIKESFLQQMNECMKQFLLKFKPSIVCQLEERYQYNWITMVPFVSAAYAYGVEMVKSSDARLKKAQSSATFTENDMPETTSSSACKESTSLSLAFALFALKVETSRSNNTQCLIKQGLLEYVAMLHWGMDDGWLDQCKWVQEEVSKAKKLPVPRLSSIAKGKLARTNQEYSGQIHVSMSM